MAGFHAPRPPRGAYHLPALTATYLPCDPLVHRQLACQVWRAGKWVSHDSQAESQAESQQPRTSMDIGEQARTFRLQTLSSHGLWRTVADGYGQAAWSS
jgi:hypothetical protein